MNVSHHAKKHPEIPKENFFYDTFAKISRKGKYNEFDGFKCCLSNRAVLDLASHIKNVHKNVKQDSPEYKRIFLLSSLKNTGLDEYLRQYKATLTQCGVGKRSKCEDSVAERYIKQIKSLVSSLHAFHKPKMIYKLLCDKTDRDGMESTRYVYLSTLKIFLTFMKVELQKQKREKYVKSYSTNKLEKCYYPYRAIKTMRKKLPQKCLL